MKKLNKIVNKREETKEKILDAARTVFAETGFKNTNIEEIAKLAKVDRASIYYHIGDKQKIYSEVLARSLKKTIEGIIEADGPGKTPKEKLKQYLASWIPKDSKGLKDNMIYFWEIASGGDNFSETYKENFSKIVEIFLDIIEDGIQSGDFRPVNPFMLHMMISGAIVLWGTLNAPRSRLVSDEFLKKHQQHFPIDVRNEIERLILQLLKKQP